MFDRAERTRWPSPRSRRVARRFWRRGVERKDSCDTIPIHERHRKLMGWAGLIRNEIARPAVQSRLFTARHVPPGRRVEFAPPVARNPHARRKSPRIMCCACSFDLVTTAMRRDAQRDGFRRRPLHRDVSSLRDPITTYHGDSRLGDCSPNRLPVPGCCSMEERPMKHNRRKPRRSLTVNICGNAQRRGFGEP
jgi:hypothetical protein